MLACSTSMPTSAWPLAPKVSGRSPKNSRRRSERSAAATAGVCSVPAASMAAQSAHAAAKFSAAWYAG